MGGIAAGRNGEYIAFASSSRTLQMQLSSLEFVGEGANGRVYRCKDELERDLAVKFFTSSFDPISRQVHSHAENLKKLNHPNVVRIISIERLNNPAKPEAAPELALVMEFVDGLKFTDWVVLANKSAEDVRTFATGLLDGLAEFHRHGQAHLDLHPGNVFVSQGRARIFDPLAHDPESILTTALTLERQRRDTRDALDLIRQALSSIHGGLDVVAELTAPRVPITTIEQLRAQFGIAISRLSGHAQASAVTGVYTLARSCGSESSPVNWQELRKRVLRDFTGKMEVAKGEISTDINSLEMAEKAARIALNASGDLLAMCITIAEAPTDVTRRTIDDIVRPLSISWPASGNSAYVHVPGFATFASLHWVGAAAVMNGHGNLALRLLNLRVGRQADKPRELYRDKSLMGWTPTFGTDCRESWTWLMRAFGKIPPLTEVFATQDDYEESLFLFNLFSSFYAFRQFSANEWEDHVANSFLDAPLSVPPYWINMKDSYKSRVLQRLAEPSILDAAFDSGRLDRIDTRRTWPRFASYAKSFWSNRNSPGNWAPEWAEQPPF